MLGRAGRALLLAMTAPLLLPASCALAEDDLATFMANEKTVYADGPLAGSGELLVRYFFRDRNDGFYVDIGCSHYSVNSTTYHLEEHQGWSGIGVDPLEYLRPGWAKHRPRSKFFAYAVTDKSGESIKFFSAGGLSASEVDTKNLEHWQELKEFEPKEVEVPTITINDLLDQQGVKKIDFLSMDINGAEPVALAGFDIKRFAPKLVHVEASPHRKEELAAYFAKHDYVRIDAYLKYDAINWYFIPKK